MVVANETLVGAHLTKRLHELHDAEPLDVLVVVPATPSGDDAAIARASANLENGLAAIRKLGIDAEGRIGQADPMAAIEYGMKTHPGTNLILLSTLPLGASRWIAMDLPHRLQRRYDIAVEHIEGSPVDSSREAHVADLPVKVLVVDDNPEDLELTKLALEGLDANVQMLVSGTGAGAVQYMREASPRPDLILLDLKMPVMDGFTMLEHFSSELGIDTLHELNVVVVSSSSAESDRDRAHALGVQAYVVKQADFDQFQATLGSLVAEVLADQVARK